jgi:hypothetical protein
MRACHPDRGGPSGLPHRGGVVSTPPDFASVAANPSTTSGADQENSLETSLGASLGWQGGVGDDDS